MAEPQDIPLYPNGQIVTFTWAEGGAATEPSSGRKATGLEAGDTPPADDFNWPWKVGAQFSRAMFSQYPKASDSLFGSWLVPGSGVWEDGINALEGYLGDGGGTNSLVADLWLDPDDEGAVRVQVSVGKASPYTFTASREHYVFVPVDLTAPPVAALADLTITVVGFGEPAPATPAGHVAVWKVTTDGTSITGQEILLPTIPVFKDIRAGTLGLSGGISVLGLAEFVNAEASSMSAGSLSVDANATVGGNLSVGGNTTLGTDDGDTVTVKGPVALEDDLSVDGEVTSGLVLAGPLLNYTHAKTSGWQDAYRPQSRTFTTSGQVPNGGGVLNLPVTSSDANLSSTLFHMGSMLATTTSATVAFDFEVLYTWGIASVPIAGEANVLASFRFTAVAKFEDGAWTGTFDGAVDEAGTANSTTVGTGVVGGQIVLATDHNMAVQNYGFRGVVTVAARVLEIADSV